MTTLCIIFCGFVFLSGAALIVLGDVAGKSDKQNEKYWRNK